MKYCIDTSALIDAGVRYYPIDVFPPLWDKFKEIINSGELFTTEVVFWEIVKIDDVVHDWCKKHSNMFKSIDDETQILVTDILNNYKKLVQTGKQRTSADPFVIALAQIKKCKVITAEKRSGNLNKPKIPDVCDQLGVECITLLELFREKSWVF